MLLNPNRQHLLKSNSSFLHPYKDWIRLPLVHNAKSFTLFKVLHSILFIHHLMHQLFSYIKKGGSHSSEHLRTQTSKYQICFRENQDGETCSFYNHIIHIIELTNLTDGTDNETQANNLAYLQGVHGCDQYAAT